jgi:uncharacterized protein YegL
MKAKKKAVKVSKTKTKKTTTAKKSTKKVVAKKTAKRTSKTETTHIIAILDRSYSMKEVAKDAINGFNSFLREQKNLKDKATFTGVLFDDQFEPLNDGKVVDIKKVQELTDKTFVPRGTTALYDAIGKSVNLYKSEIQKNKKAKPANKVLVIVVTDGHENTSREFTRNDIADLITYQKKQNWQFLFLCSTEDAVTVGASLGVSKGNTFKFENTSLGNNEMYSKVSYAAVNYRGMSSKDSLNLSDSLLSDGDEG